MKRIIKGFFVFLLIIVIAAGVAAGINFVMNQNVYLTEYDYTSEKLPGAFDGCRIAVISDIHNSVYADKFIALLRQSKPDIVLFAGDMIQQPDTNLDNVLKIVNALPEEIPVYGIFGNHEASNGYVVRKQISGALREAGVTMLINSADDITKDGETIRIIGIEDKGDEVIGEEIVEQIKKTVQSSKLENAFQILAYHRADVYPKLHDLPVDLILSGHMHGGIIRVPFVGGVFGKNGELFPQYTEGMYKEMNTTMIVSRGCDYNPQKMRIFNPPEVVMVTLKRQ